MKKENKKQAYKRREFEIKPLNPNFELPVRVKRGSIGYDLKIPEDTIIPAHTRVAIPIGFAINLPYGTEGKIESRSGFAKNGMEGWGRKTTTKKLLGFIPVKKQLPIGFHRYDADVITGKVDPCYTDEVHVLVKNNGDDPFTLKAGKRIAQLTFYQVGSPFFLVVDELTCKSRGGGLGSSGTERIGKKRKKEEAPVEAAPAPHVSSEEEIYQEEVNDTDNENDSTHEGAFV